VCFGKTFAENTVRTTLPIFFHLLNMEIVDPKVNEEKPENNTLLQTTPVIKVKVTKRQH
jgi:cytochrome P450